MFELNAGGNPAIDLHPVQVGWGVGGGSTNSPIRGVASHFGLVSPFHTSQVGVVRPGKVGGKSSRPIICSIHTLLQLKVAYM